jgi:hypothetical protein
MHPDNARWVAAVRVHRAPLPRLMRDSTGDRAVRIAVGGPFSLPCGVSSRT